MRSLADYRAMAAGAPPVRGMRAILGRPGLAVIAEFKRRSPSRGVLCTELDPVEQVMRYEAGGAAGVSVLTEPDHFWGSDDDLKAVRAVCSIPVLRKDFTLDSRQVWEARAIGADAVLLIAAALDQTKLSELHEAGREAGLDILVEVHSEAEAERALDLGADLIGVNNRDLTTFEVDLATSERLAPMLAGAGVIVAESGIHNAADAARMVTAGFDAVLVGESLVLDDDPAALIASLKT